MAAIKWDSNIFSTRFKECISSLSRREVGLLTGLGYYTIDRLMKNKSQKPSLRTAALIAASCNVSLDWMFGLSDKKELK